MAPSPHFVIFTTAARERHAQRTLETVTLHHPNALSTVIVIDDRYGEISRARPGWRALTGSDVGSGDRRLAELALVYPPTTRLAAVRPGALRSIAGTTTADVLVVVSDDAEVRAPLNGFAQLGADHGLALVPVRASVAPRDGRLPDPYDELAAGRLDQDILAISTVKGLAFLAWWDAHIADGPFDDPGRFDPVTHPWLDDAFLVHRAALLAHGLVRSYRNLDESGDPDVGSPVLIARFPSFDVNRPWLLSSSGGDWPRTLLSAYPAMELLSRERAAAITAPSIRRPSLDDPYARLPNGHYVDRPMQTVYRRALLGAKRHALPEPPNPFVAGEAAAFQRWLAEPVEGLLPRHLVALRADRTDIAVQFAGNDGALLAWARADAARVKVWTPIPPSSTTTNDPPKAMPLSLAGSLMRNEVRSPTNNESSGVNLIGLLSAQLGVGEYARLAARAVRDARIPFSIVDHDDTVNERDPSLLEALGASAIGFRYDVDFVLVNADQTRRALDQHRRGGRRERPTIGLWAWEVCEFPDRMHDAFACVDEVWVPTDFVREAVGPVGERHDVAVHHFPLQLPSVRPRPPRTETAAPVQALGLDPDRPLFLFAFDYFSVAERKQPWAVVEAYRRAFPTFNQEGPQLVIKSINDAFHPSHREHLLHAINARPDIHLVETYLPAATRDALVAHATAYVSLHRSEGLGLTLAEAMAIGTPCVATNWSGNLDFMTDANSFLIDARSVPIAADTPVYAGLGSWAEPDLDQAAETLRWILEDPNEASARASRAQVDLDTRNTSGADVAFLLQRLRAVRQARGGRMVR